MKGSINLLNWNQWIFYVLFHKFLTSEVKLFAYEFKITLNLLYDKNEIWFLLHQTWYHKNKIAIE